MSIGKTVNSLDIAVSGLRAQSMRMKVISNNIANANTGRTQTGKPYRRKDVMLSTDDDSLAGVRIEGLGIDDDTPFQRQYDPGSPDADADGYVAMPNVQVPVEMMRMMAASRAYQANVAVLKRYQEGVDVTLELLK